MPSLPSPSPRARAGASVFALALAAGLGLGAAPALAADGADGAEAQPQPTEVPEVTVYGRRAAEGYRPESTSTATRTDTPITEVPQAISIITAELIEDQAMQGMADVVRYVPGVTMGQGEGHRDAPTLRGNATTADFFVDGLRDDVQYYRDLYNAERVEVLKGPNAMIFGRGGGGGVINRVTKSPQRLAERSFTLEGGSHDHLRLSADLNQPLSDAWAGRLNLLWEDSGGYRDFVGLERWGVNPTLAFRPNDNLSLQLGYEHFEDERTVDRGVPSYQGRPLPTDPSAFFGDPDASYATAEVDVFSAAVQYVTNGGLIIRNRTTWADYDKFYQNVFPGAVSADGSTFSLAAYNNATARRNLFSQTDVIAVAWTGAVEHTLLFGAELGRQETDNFRMSGTFATSPFTAPVTSPTVRGAPVTFAQSPTDADNRSEASVAAIYVQDQIRLNDQWRLVAGLRLDSFDLEVRDHRTGVTLDRRDELVSPRLGLIWKPVEPLSLYASYSVSYLPGSGDQFASLTPSSQALEPEKFTNYEVGAHWSVTPDLLLSAALYQLDRTNTTARDPLDPSRIVQTGETRSRGFELGVSGRITEAWEIMGGYAWQDVEITSDTTAAPAGRRLPLTPEHSFSLWNRYQIDERWGAGVGIIRQGEMYAGIDNTVVMPAFTRVDAAVYIDLNAHVRAQLNVENLFDETYWSTAHSNNNITPGAPRLFRASVTTRF